MAEDRVRGSLPDNLQQRVSRALRSRLEAERQAARALSVDLDPLYELAAGFLEGGKRFRARCALIGSLCAEASSPPAPAEALTGLACALEVFHASALVHDDLIDASDTRRGAPSSHRALERAHEAAGYRGDAAAFGEHAAIIFGDLLLALADDLVHESMRALGGLRREREDPVRTEFGIMRREVMLGQYLDLLGEHAWAAATGEDATTRALRVVTLKTARYSIEQPLILGALLGGASAGRLATLRAFGRPVGVAFQLRDDLLGVFGDASVTGKPSGDDLREGKRTVLIAETLLRVSEEDARRINAGLGDPALSAVEIEVLRGIIEHSGAVAAIEERIRGARSEAARALEADAELTTAQRGMLETLASRVLERTS